MANDNKLWLVDCIGGQKREIGETPFKVGASPGADFPIEGPGVEDGRDLFRIRGGHEEFQIFLETGIGSFFFDGQEATQAVIRDVGDHTLVVGGRPFVLRCDGETGRDWFAEIDPSQWFVYERGEHEWKGPVAPNEVPLMTTDEPGKFIVMCGGMNNMGFYAYQVTDVLARTNGVPADAEPAPVAFADESGIDGEEWTSAEPQLEVSEVDTEYGEFTCPTCWLKFDRGDVMNIAVHADLRGDPVLGEEHMLRFYATRFNDRNQALDAMGLPSPDYACPHCRRRLPPGFLDEQHYIFSIVGAPSSGKSYYLSVLIKILQSKLFKKFGSSFRDAAPADNAVLNDMRNHLFSASKPEDAYLAKTELEGALYETLPRMGREVRLPKPFVYRISTRGQEGDGFSLVFYDNAGEHFEPGRNSADSPGAQHIAVASGVFFLFDPLFNPEFRRRIREADDPQLKQQRNDQQDVILAESEVRIKQILGLSTEERISTPLAVIVGKSDAWIDLLGPEPLLPVLGKTEQGGGLVLTSNIRKNSDRIRTFLSEISPGIVANAEEISSDIRYFAVSPLGHPPVTFVDDQGTERIGPDPEKLDPQRVEDATLWVLSKIAPAFFPSDEPA